MVTVCRRHKLQKFENNYYDVIPSKWCPNLFFQLLSTLAPYIGSEFKFYENLMRLLQKLCLQLPEYQNRIK